MNKVQSSEQMGGNDLNEKLPVKKAMEVNDKADRLLVVRSFLAG